MIVTMQELEALISELDEGRGYVEDNVDMNTTGMLGMLDQFDLVMPGLERAYNYATYLTDEMRTSGVCRNDMETLYSLPGLESYTGKVAVGNFTAKKSGVNLEVALEQANHVVGMLILIWVATYITVYVALTKFLRWLLGKLFKSEAMTFKFQSHYKDMFGDSANEVRFRSNIKAILTLKSLKMNTDFLSTLFESASESLDWYAGEVGKLEGAMSTVLRLGRVGDTLSKMFGNTQRTDLYLEWRKLRNKQIPLATKLAAFCGVDIKATDDSPWDSIKIGDWDKQVGPEFSYTHSELEAVGILKPAGRTEDEFKGLVEGAESVVEKLTSLNDKFDGKAFEIERELRDKVRTLMGDYKTVGSEVRTFVGVAANYAGVYINLRMKLVRHFGKALDSSGANYRLFMGCVDAFITALRKGEQDDAAKEVDELLKKFDETKKMPSDYAELATAAQSVNSSLFAEVCGKRGVASWVITAIAKEEIPIEEERLLLTVK